MASKYIPLACDHNASWCPPMLHIKGLGSKGPRYLIMQHFSCPCYIIHDNTHKSDNYFLIISLR